MRGSESKKLLHINFDNEWKIIMDIKKRKIFFTPTSLPARDTYHSPGKRRRYAMISKSSSTVLFCAVVKYSSYEQHNAVNSEWRNGWMRVDGAGWCGGW